MSEMRKYKKWGMPFSIIGFINGIQAFVNSITFAISMSVMTAASYGGFSYNFDLVKRAMLIAIISSMVIGIVFSIVGLIGWRRKAMSIVGIIFSVLSTAPLMLGVVLSLS